MRFREKAAVLACAALLSFSFASRAPLADDKPVVQKPFDASKYPELKGMDPKKLNKLQEIGIIPNSEPMKFWKMLKVKKKLEKIVPKDYDAGFLRGVVEKTKPLITDMKKEGGSFSFGVKPVELANGKMLSAKVKINNNNKAWKNMPSITFRMSNAKGMWICGIPFDTLIKKYEEKKGVKPDFAVYGMDRKENGDIDFYIIPVATLGDAENGSIKAGVPVLVIPYIAKKDGFFASFGRNVHNVVGEKESKGEEENPYL
ncbi:hypothetical protein H0O02_02740 [Candidatus Micrarchaeota archaeon]|nr:hypothetical protein [Candidatus Micrarchaeota archaeon]